MEGPQAITVVPSGYCSQPGTPAISPVMMAPTGSNYRGKRQSNDVTPDDNVAHWYTGPLIDPCKAAPYTGVKEYGTWWPSGKL